MRFAVLMIVVAACGGPITPPYATPSRAPSDPDPKVLRPPANAPPDPIGTTRPGNRSCTENRDCKVGEVCFAPDYVAPIAAGSGSAAPLQCQGDAQCTTGLVCAAGACVAACSEGSCGPGLECRAGGRCMPIACTAPQAPVCAQNFRCNTGSGTCERQACTSRAQCDSGVCFQGRCFAHDAYCMPQNSSSPK